MLFCHGVFGYAHQVGGGAAVHEAHKTHAAPMGTHHASSHEGEGHTSQHATAAGGYFAVLISVLLGVILWPWSRSFRLPAVRATRHLKKRLVAPLVPYPPRGPTLYLFQVIRL